MTLLKSALINKNLAKKAETELLDRMINVVRPIGCFVKHGDDVEAPRPRKQLCEPQITPLLRVR